MKTTLISVLVIGTATAVAQYDNDLYELSGRDAIYYSYGGSPAIRARWAEADADAAAEAEPRYKSFMKRVGGGLKKAGKVAAKQGWSILSSVGETGAGGDGPQGASHGMMGRMFRRGEFDEDEDDLMANLVARDFGKDDIRELYARDSLDEEDSLINRLVARDFDKDDVFEIDTRGFEEDENSLTNQLITRDFDNDDGFDIEARDSDRDDLGEEFQTRDFDEYKYEYEW